MKIIQALQIENENGLANYPAEKIPENAALVVFDGANYVVYESGDALPEPAAVEVSTEQNGDDLRAQLLSLLQQADEIMSRIGQQIK